MFYLFLPELTDMGHAREIVKVIKPNDDDSRHAFLSISRFF